MISMLKHTPSKVIFQIVQFLRLGTYQYNITEYEIDDIESIYDNFTDNDTIDKITIIFGEDFYNHNLTHDGEDTTASLRVTVKADCGGNWTFDIEVERCFKGCAT